MKKQRFPNSDINCRMQISPHCIGSSAISMTMTMFQDENDWLREELEDTERRLEDALSRFLSS